MILLGLRFTVTAANFLGCSDGIPLSAVITIPNKNAYCRAFSLLVLVCETWTGMTCID
jgi:hypothetical protein